MARFKSIDEMTALQLSKGNGVNVEENEIPNFLKTCYSLKPGKLKMPELTWKFLIRNVLRGKNILLVGPSGCAKTMAAHAVESALKRPFFSIPLGSTQDPRSALVGNQHYSKEKGTYFSNSYFVEAISTPHSIVLLDEISRAHPEAWNLLMPVLDFTQRYLRLEEKEDGATVQVAEGVSFIATANIGSEYTSTRVLDRALVDRFVIVEMQPLEQPEEHELLKEMFPSVDEGILKSLSSISAQTRKEAGTEGSKLTTAISTRLAVETAGLLQDGFNLIDAAEVSIFPFFSSDGGNDSERTYVKQLVQKYITPEPEVTPSKEPLNESDILFTDEDIKSATP
jgi:nitric oxide reductase NorQ protein